MKSLYAIGWYFVLAGIWSLYLVSECRDALLASGVRS